MKMKNLIKTVLLSSIIILSSCEKDSNNTPGPLDCANVEYGIATTDDCGFCHSSYMYNMITHTTTPVATYADTIGMDGMFVLAGSPSDIASNPMWNASCYIFTHDENSTVSYGGQTARLIMASEMLTAVNSSSTTLADLLSMWSNDGWTWASDDANASTKNIGGKTASGNETPLTSVESAAVIDKFVGWFTDYADNVAQIMDGDATSHPAMAGTAGWVENRELNAHGFEYDQFVAKTLIGCLLYTSPSPRDH